MSIRNGVSSHGYHMGVAVELQLNEWAAWERRVVTFIADPKATLLVLPSILFVPRSIAFVKKTQVMASETQPLLTTSPSTSSPAPQDAPTTSPTEKKLSLFRWIQLISVNAILLGVVGVIAGPATSPLVLFSAHPTFVGLFIILAANGLLLQQNVPPAEKRKRTVVHLYVLFAALILITVAFSAIYMNKDINHSAHFYSVHGKYGAFTFLALWTIAIFGLLIHTFPGYLGGPLKVRKYLYPLHRIVGYIIFTLVIMTASFAMLGTWAVAKFSPEVRAWIAGGFVSVWVLVVAGISWRGVLGMKSAARSTQGGV
ncbi:hypothetical protein HDU67_002484 [Dinochytrium kinnereticum]|nr:hypothetical protein HDU67_002484 [Dinochytrium kinnereticum]